MKRVIYIVFLIGVSLAMHCGKNIRITTCRQINSPSPETHASIIGKAQEKYLTSATRWYENRQNDSALVDLHKAYADNPSNWRIYYLYALLALDAQRPIMAQEYGNQALILAGTDKPTRALLYAVLGLAEEQRSRYGEAKAHFMTSLRLDDSCRTALDGLKRLQQLTVAP